MEELDLDIQINALTRKPYSGKNIGILAQAQFEGEFPTGEWVTFKQALELGRCVKKGQKAAARILKIVPKKAEKADGSKDEKRKKNVVKTYAVFNIAQTEVLEEKKEKVA